MDRIHESLHEKYTEGFYKKKTESPYSVSIGGNLDSFSELLASSFVISMYNGSLTYILLFYQKIRDFAFYLSCKYSDWQFRRLLLQFAVFAGKEKEIKDLTDSYPEILNQLTAADAIAVMDFCNNHPIPYIQDDIPTTIAVASIVNKYLASTDSAVLPHPLGTIALQNVLQWLHSEHLDLRYIATKILLQFACNPENESVVNRRIINLVDSECIYIKNLIVNNIYTAKGIWAKTIDYVVSKCENDECFIVRKACAEQKKQHSYV